MKFTQSLKNIKNLKNLGATQVFKLTKMAKSDNMTEKIKEAKMEEKDVSLASVEAKFSKLRTYSYSPVANKEKIVEVFGLANFGQYESKINEKYRKFKNGDSVECVPIKILGEQPKGGLFGLKRKKIDRENWERFYTQEGRHQIIDLTMKNALESYEKFQEAAKACADEQGDLKRLQSYFSALDVALNAFKAWEIYDTTVLLQDNPFFLQDFVRWYKLEPAVMNGDFSLGFTKNTNFQNTPAQHWNKELNQNLEME